MAWGRVFRIKARGSWRATQVHEPAVSAGEKKQKNIAVPSSAACRDGALLLAEREKPQLEGRVSRFSKNVDLWQLSSAAAPRRVVEPRARHRGNARWRSIVDRLWLVSWLSNRKDRGLGGEPGSLLQPLKLGRAADVGVSCRGQRRRYSERQTLVSPRRVEHH